MATWKIRRWEETSMILEAVVIIKTLIDGNMENVTINSHCLHQINKRILFTFFHIILSLNHG